MNKIPVYDILLGDTEGLTKMSLVEYPAVEENFLAFNKQQKMEFAINEEEHIIFGCALRANYPIYRCDYFGEYFVNFSTDVIKQLYEKFMIDSKFNNINLNHGEDTSDIYLIQSFLKDSEKGISPVGFEDVENGSWFVAYKILNENVWNKVKSGEFKGFSVEMFCELERKFEKQDEKPEMDLIDEILNSI